MRKLLILYTCLVTGLIAQTETPPRVTPAPVTPPPATPPPESPAEKPPEKPVAVLSETNLTVEAFEATITNLSTRTDLKPELLTAITNTYKEALSRVKERDGLIAKKAVHDNAASTALQQLEALKAETNKGTTEITEAQKALSSTELKALLTQAEADESASQKALEKIKEEAKRRKTRTQEIPKLITVANEKLGEINAALQNKPAPEEAVEVTQANRLLLLARKSFRENEVSTLQAELKDYQETSELLTLQTDQQTSRTTAMTKLVAQLREQIATVSKKEAEQAAAKAAEEARILQEAFWKNFPELGEFAKTNTELAAEQKQLNQRISRLNTSLTESEQHLAKLQADFQAVKERVEAFELANVRINRTIGDMLRKHRSQLAESLNLNLAQNRLSEITDTSIRELEHHDNRQQLSDIQSLVDTMMEHYQSSQRLTDEDSTQKVYKRASDLLRTQREQHNSLAIEYKNLGDLLTRINAIDVQTRLQSDQFSQYIEERVLWVKSSDIFQPKAIWEEFRILSQQLDYANWTKCLQALKVNAADNPLKLIGFLVLFLGVVGFRSRIQTVRKHFTQIGSTKENTALLPTLICLVCYVLLAAPIPILLWMTSSMLKGSATSQDFISGISVALSFAGTIWFAETYLRLLTNKSGIGLSHFSWTEKSCTLVSKQLRWFFPVSVILAFWITFVEHSQTEYHEARLGFVVLMLSLLVVNFRLAHPRHGLWRPTAKKEGSQFWIRAYYMVLILTPLVLIVGSLLGYHFTAWELSWRVLETILLFLMIFMIRIVGVRWFYLERKRVALEKLKQRQSQSTKSGETSSPFQTDSSLSSLSISAIKEQTQSLTRTIVFVCAVVGMWGIWAEITPALKILDREALWYIEVPAEHVQDETATSDVAMITGITGDSSTDEAQPLSTVQEPVTLADLLMAIGIIVVTILLFKNLPSFLELMILRHLKLETGGAYAITTLIQYIVIVIGVIISFSSIGVTWEKVQWLAAAVTLGIGFGLQEIFANFVAGIILLFERPVRVGDVITVDGTTGTVSRIRIRATTITNWERQELVIPNKDLVTGRLTNWTLSDTTNRLVTSVGVAYGTDIKKAREILLDIVNNHPTILKDPPPRVTFDLFGDSSLNFTLRTFLSKMDDRLETIHTLHEQINDRFNEADIEISFPQRDLHIRTGLEFLKPSTEVKDVSKQSLPAHHP
jgi:potassium efflux system protein